MPAGQASEPRDFGQGDARLVRGADAPVTVGSYLGVLGKLQSCLMTHLKLFFSNHICKIISRW